MGVGRGWLSGLWKSRESRKTWNLPHAAFLRSVFEAMTLKMGHLLPGSHLTLTSGKLSFEALSLRVSHHGTCSEDILQSAPKGSFLRQKPHRKHSWAKVLHEWGQENTLLRGLRAVVLPLPDTALPHLPTDHPAAVGSSPLPGACFYFL